MSSALNFIEDNKVVKQSSFFTMRAPSNGRWVLACQDGDGTISYGTVSGNSTTFVMEHGTFVVTYPTRYTAGEEAKVSYTFTLTSKHEDIQDLGKTADDAEALHLNYSFVQQIQGQNGVNDVPQGQEPPATEAITAVVNIAISGTNDAPTLEILQGSATIIDMREDEDSASGKILAHDVDGDALTTTINDEELSLESGVETSISGKYGDLVAQADGSFEYQLVSNPDDDRYTTVQKLTAGQKVTETFTIETSDDASSASKTLTYTIYGQNDAPTVEAHDVYNPQGVFTNEDFTGFIKGGDAETADSALKYALVNDIGTAYAGVTKGTTTTYTTEYGVVTLQRVVESDFATEADFEANALGYKYKFEPNYEHPALATLAEGESFNLPFHVEVRDAQGLASESVDLNLTVEGRGVFIFDGQLSSEFYDLPFAITPEDVLFANVIAIDANGNPIRAVPVDADDNPTDIPADIAGYYIPGAHGKLFFSASDTEQARYVPSTMTDNPALEVFTFKIREDIGSAYGDPINWTLGSKEGVTLSSATFTDKPLIDAGVGRDRDGDDITSTSPHTAYAGDLTARGSMELGGEMTVSKYVLFNANGDAYEGRTSGANSTYVTEYGTVTLSRTADGVNYSLTLNKTSEAIQALDHNDGFALTFQIAAQDAKGSISEPSSVTFNVTGTNEAPVLSIMRDANDVTVNANENLYDTSATGKIIINDADAGDHFMNQTLTGKATLVSGVVAEELSNEEQANGTVLVIEGKYGNLTIDTTGNYVYSLATEGKDGFTQEQIEALKLLGNGVKATETFTITTTDRFGASDSQNVAFTVTGANDQPAVLTEQIDMNYIAAGVGREKDGSIITLDEGDDPKLENVIYNAVPAKIFIPISDDTGDTWTPQLQYGSAGETYTGNTITIAELGKFTFAVATVDEKRGYNVTFTPNAAYAEHTKDELSEGSTSLETLYFSVKDKLGLVSDTVNLNLTAEGSNAAPTMAITIDEGFDTSVSLPSEFFEDTTVNGLIDITDDENINSGHLQIVQGSKLSGYDIEKLDSSTLDLDGTYGTLTIMKDELTGELHYEYRLDPVEENAALDALTSSKVKEKESFEIIFTDEHGASVTKTIDITVSGANVAPEVTVNPTTDGALIAAGVGRDKVGDIYEVGEKYENVTPAQENTIYAGDLTAKGTVSVRDADGDKYSFELQDAQGNPIEPSTASASKWTYLVGEDFGNSNLVVTKTPSGYSYTFTLDKNAAGVKALNEGDQHISTYKLLIIDAVGNVGKEVDFDFTIKGTNDAPAINITHETDVSVSLMGENAVGVTADTTATSRIEIFDIDEGSSHTFSIVHDKTTSGASNNGTTISQGKYGTLTITKEEDGTSSMVYELQSELLVAPDPADFADGENDPAYLAAQRDYQINEEAALARYNAAQGLTDKSVTESFTIIATDENGATKSQTVSYKVYGENNSAPEVSGITYGSTKTTDADLKAAGYNDQVASEVVKAYAGDLKASGTIKSAKDGDDDIPVFKVQEPDIRINDYMSITIIGDPVISGNKITYEIGHIDAGEGDIIGTLVLSKSSATATSASYTFTVNKESEYIKSLTSDDNFKLDIPIVAIDNRGGESAPQHIELSIQGSNDAHAVSVTGVQEITIDANAGAMQEEPLEPFGIIEGSITITDPDWENGTEAVIADYDFSIAYGKTQGKVDPDFGEESVFVVSGKYGNYIFDTSDGSWAYAAGMTSAQKLAASQLEEGETQKDIFTVTTTGPDGIKTITSVEMLVTGSNDAPVVSGLENGIINVKDALIMSGVGRNASGLDVHDAAVSANTAYKGDFVAKGSVAVKDFDGDTLTYSMEGIEAIRVSSTTNRFETEYGDITITKTNSGFNYSLTLTPDASLHELKHGETANLSLTVTADDGQGNMVEVPLQFTVTGTNDIPIIISNDVEGIIDLGYVQADVANSNVIEHAFSYSDADNGDAAMQMSITLNGTTKRFENIEELTEETLLIEGTYGNVYYDVDNENFVYKSGESDAQKLALQNIGANKVVQDNFSITLQDENGGQTTKVFENKLIGSDIPLGETTLELTVNSTNTTIIGDGVGRDAKGNDITVSANPNADNTQYGGDFTASGTITVPADFRAEDLMLENMKGTVVGNTTTFTLEDIGTFVFTKTNTGYNYVFTADKETLRDLTHGEEINIGELLPFTLGDTYAKIHIPLTFIGTNNAPVVEVNATDNDYTVFEAADGENSDSVSGVLEIYDVDSNDTLTYVLINGEKVALPAIDENAITVSGAYGDLEIAAIEHRDEYTYTYTLGVTDAQKAALAAHDNYDMQHEKFTLELMDKWGATTSQDLNFDILRDGAPTLDMASALTATQDSDLYDDEHTDETLNTDSAEGSFTVANANSDTRIEITGENGITYDVLALDQDGLLSSLSIDGKYGTFTEFAFNQDTGKVFYTYTQFVDAPHTTKGQDLVDSLDVRVLGEKGQVFATGSSTNTIENLQSFEGEDFSLSQIFNTALDFTSADADSLVLPSVGANNKSSAGDITATGKLTGTAFDEEYNKIYDSNLTEIPTKIHFDLYDADGEKIHAETHGIYTKFFSDMGIVTLKQTATGMDYSFTLNPEYEGFKDLPLGFTTSFPFTLVATQEIIYEDSEPTFKELGREDLGIEVTGGNDAPEINLVTFPGAGALITGFTWVDADSNDSHTVEAIYNKKTYDVVDSDSSDTSNLIMGKYGVIGIELDGHTHGDYSYLEATDENETMLQQRWPDFAFTDAQKAAYAALGEYVTDTEIVQLKVTDEHGAFTQKSLEITVTGVDDPLVLTGVTEKEHTLNEPGAATKAISGFFTYTDADGEKPYIWSIDLAGSINTEGIQWELSSSTTSAATYSSEYGTLTLSNATFGRINYSFKLNDKALEVQKLAVGEELNIGFTLTTGQKEAQLNFIVNGTNDAPTMRHENYMGMTVALNENSGETPQYTPTYMLSSTQGTLNINDIDNGDHVIMTISSAGKQSVNHHEPHYTEQWAHNPDDPLGNGHMEQVRDGNAYTMHGTYGTLTVQPDGSYTYALPDPNGELTELQQKQLELIEKIADGKSLKESFTVTVEDGNGGKVSQTLTFTVSNPVQDNASDPNIPPSDNMPPVFDWDATTMKEPFGPPEYPEYALNLNYIASGVGRDADGNTSESSMPVDPNMEYEAKPATGFVAVSDPNGDTVIPALYNFYQYDIQEAIKSSTNNAGVTTFTTELGKVVFTPGERDGVAGFEVSFAPTGNYDSLAQGETLAFEFHFVALDDKRVGNSAPFTLTIEGTNNAPELTIKALTDTKVTAYTDDNSVTWQADIFDVENWTKFIYNPENPDPSMMENHPPFIYDIQQVVAEGEESNPVQSEEIKGETIIFIDGNYGTLVFNPENNTFTYTLDNAKLAEAMANAEGAGKSITFPISESFDIIAKDENGATVSKPIEVTIAGLNTAPVVENITYGSSTTTNAELIAAGVGRDATGAIYEDSTVANENKAYAGDLRATGKIEVSDADKDSYVPVISSGNENITVSEAVVKGSTYTFTLSETISGEPLGTLVLTKSGTDFNYTFTLSKTSMYIKGLDEGQVVNLNLGVQMVDKHGSISSLLTQNDNSLPGLTPSLNFTIIGSNDGPSLVMNHDMDLNVSLRQEGVEGIVSDARVFTNLDIFDYDKNDTHTFSATFVNGKKLVTATEDTDPNSETYGVTIIEGKYGTLTIESSNATHDRPIMTYTLATEGSQYEAALALKDGSTKETFTITVTDASGATKSQSITYTVRGENNFAPVISDIVESNTTLFDDGFGREANGTDSATWNKAYKGDLTASGTIKASDGDKDVLSFSMKADGFSLNEDRSTATTKYYDSDYGTLAITSKGTYTFTMKEDNAAINALAHGETMTLGVNIFAHDGRGGTSEPHELTFTIEGTDDGPSFNFAADPSNWEATEAEFEVKEGDVTATGVVVMHDVDDKTFDNSSYDYKLSQGKVVGTEDGDIITLEGKYGILIFNTSNNEYKYELDPSNPDYRKLSEGTELFESFVLTATDPKGISGTQELKFTINGSNSSPTVQINATTPDSMFYDPHALYKGNIVIDDSDLDGDTLKELTLHIGGQKIDTTKNGTTSIVMEGSSTEVTMEDGVTYTIPGDPIGTLSVTINGNNCSYVFRPYGNYTGAHKLEIPVEVFDKHDASTTQDIIVDIKSLALSMTEDAATAIEGGQAIVGTFADMGAYADADWADVDIYITPNTLYGPVSSNGGWLEVWPLPADVNGMGKPDQYYESDFGTIAFYHKTGQYVFNPAPDSIHMNTELSFTLNFSGSHAQMFTPNSAPYFTINLTNTHAPELDINEDQAETAVTVEFNDAATLSSVSEDILYSNEVTLRDADTDDMLAQSIIYDGEVYEPNEHGVIMVEGEYGRLFYDTNNGSYNYTLKTVNDSFVLDPAVREMLALKEGQSLEEVFTFSVVDKYNARVEENFTAIINGTDQNPEFVILSGSKDEGVYGTAITGTFNLQDLENNANVINEYTLKVAGQDITLANNKSINILVDADGNALASGASGAVGTLTITRSGNNYKYSFKGDADSDAQLEDIHNISIEAYAKGAAEGANPIASKVIDFDVTQKQLSISGSVAKTVKESSTAVLNGTIADGRITAGKLSTDAVNLSVALYANGKMVAGDSDFWSKVDMTAEGYEQPDGFAVNNANIVTLFQSNAGDVAFYDTGYYRFIPSGEHSVDENTSFDFFFEDFGVTGADAGNYSYDTPKFTLTIVDDMEAVSRPPAPPAPVSLSAEEAFVAEYEAEEFIITDFTSLYTEEVQGGSGNDLVSIDVSLEGLKVEDVLGIDGGEGMDVLLSGVDNLETVKDLMEAGKITDMEIIIAGEAHGSDADTVREELGIVDDDNDGILDLENHGWSKTESTNAPQGYAEYKNEDDSMTILVQQTLLGNSQA